MDTHLLRVPYQCSSLFVGLSAWVESAESIPIESAAEASSNDKVCATGAFTYPYFPVRAPT